MRGILFPAVFTPKPLLRKASVVLTLALLVVLAGGAAPITHAADPASARTDFSMSESGLCKYVNNTLTCETIDYPRPGCVTIRTLSVLPGKVDPVETVDVGCPSSPPPGYVEPKVPVNTVNDSYELSCSFGQGAHIHWYSNQGSGQRSWHMLYWDEQNNLRSGSSSAYLGCRSSWCDWDSGIIGSRDVQVEEFGLYWSTYAEAVSGGCT